MGAATDAVNSGAAEAAVRLRALLDETEGRLLAGEVAGAVDDLCLALRDLRGTMDAAEWREVIVPACLAHPVRGLLHQDPYTHRAFAKPRGYAGDAELLDYVYDGVASPGTSVLGRAVFAATTGSPNGRSVVERRNRLAALIDGVAGAVERPRILAVACGHLREGQRARAVREGRFGDFLALDQDAASLAVVAREQAHLGVSIVHASVTRLLRGSAPASGLHLAYAAGLYDYLPDQLAACLTATLFGMLAPGGRLLIATFTPDCHGRGYMEAFMDWRLIYRDEHDLTRLLGALPATEIAASAIARDDRGNIAYLEVTRC